MDTNGMVIVNEDLIKNPLNGRVTEQHIVVQVRECFESQHYAKQNSVKWSISLFRQVLKSVLIKTGINNQNSEIY